MKIYFLRAGATCFLLAWPAFSVPGAESQPPCLDASQSVETAWTIRCDLAAK